MQCYKYTIENWSFSTQDINSNLELKINFSCIYLSCLALYFIFCWSLKEGFIVRLVFFCFFSHHDEHTASKYPSIIREGVGSRIANEPQLRKTIFFRGEVLIF